MSGPGGRRPPCACPPWSRRASRSALGSTASHRRDRAPCRSRRLDAGTDRRQENARLSFGQLLSGRRCFSTWNSPRRMPGAGLPRVRPNSRRAPPNRIPSVTESVGSPGSFRPRRFRDRPRQEDETRHDGERRPEVAQDVAPLQIGAERHEVEDDDHVADRGYEHAHVALMRGVHPVPEPVPGPARVPEPWPPDG